MRSIIISTFWGALFAVALLVSNPASAPAQTAAPNAPTNPTQTQQTPGGKFVQDLGNQAITIMADKNMAPEQRSQKYRAILQNSFDMPTIGRFVLGRAWNSATPQQQQEFLKLFEQIVLKTYGDRL